MTDLFLFCLVLLIIGAIARYNESNKLFWTLLTPFVVAFAVAKMVCKESSSAKQSEQVVLQSSSPTQSAALTPSTLMYLLAGDSVTAPKKKTSTFVGKDSISAIKKDSLTSSDVVSKTRDQPVHMFPNPPNDVIPYDTS